MEPGKNPSIRRIKRQDVEPDLWARAAHMTRSTGWMSDAQLLDVWIGEERAALLVIQCIRGGTAEQHTATFVKDWATARAMRAVFVMLNKVFGIENLLLPIPRGNVVAQVAALKAGFRIDGVQIGGSGDGSDAIIFSASTERMIQKWSRSHRIDTVRQRTQKERG